MGRDIHGWVEVKRYPELEAEPDKGAGLDLSPWASAVDAGSLLGRNKDMFCLLFLPRGALLPPLAPLRGLPPDLSARAKADRAQVDEGGYAITADDHSHSWIGWDEIQAIDWDETIEPLADGSTTRREILDSEWECLFKMMDALGAMYGVANVRLVVWFDG